MNSSAFTIQDLDKSVRRLIDFPKKGIVFYDITSVLVNPKAFKFCIDKMIEIYSKPDSPKIDAVAGIESRGFVFAAPFAEKMGIPFILIRKKGKLPGQTYSCSYNLEYGTAEIEIQKSDVQKGQNILLVDDLIATGGTIEAAKKLVQMCGAKSTDAFGVIGLPDLNYQKTLESLNVTTLINYHGA